jgi:hypothetical protein
MSTDLQIDYRALAAELIRTKAVSSTPDAVYGHGPNGLFSTPGVDLDIYNAMQLPTKGLESLLPEYPTNLALPNYAIITGQTATSGSEPSVACADWPEAGLMQIGIYQTTLSRQGRSSRVYDISRVGQRINNADLMDYRLIGDPTGADARDENAPGGIGVGAGDKSLNTELAKGMRELRTAFIRDFAPDLYTGNPANNSGTGRMYYRGLDLLINTGYTDVISSTAMPAADSIVVNFGGGDIGVNPNGQNLVLQMVDIYRRLGIIAEEAGLDPVTWAIAMPRSLFYEVTAAWPCAYYTNRCQLPGSNTEFVNSRDQIEMRDQMRAGNYLLIDGEKVKVVPDTAIARTALTGVDAGSFTGSIYFVPLTVLGNKSVTYKQYFDYSGPGAAEEFLSGLGGNIGSFFKVTDKGKYLWLFQPPTSYCIQIEAMSRMTLVLRTPYLAARLTNVRWTPIAVERSPFTTDPTYVAGGVSTR